MKRQLGIPVFSFLFIQVGTVVFAATCGTPLIESSFPLKNHTCLDLINESPSVFSTADLEYAKSQWSGCPGMGTDIPSIHVGTSKCKDVRIRHVPGKNPEPGGAM